MSNYGDERVYILSGYSPPTMSITATDASTYIPNIGEWLAVEHDVSHNWLRDLIENVVKRPKPFHPVIQEFKDLIEDDPQLYVLFHQMFEEVPTKPPYNKDPTGAPQVRQHPSTKRFFQPAHGTQVCDYHLMLSLFNELLTHAPEYNDSVLVGFPYNAILDWPICTKAGYAVFLNEKVNNQLRKMLAVWTDFLESSDSRYVLNHGATGGWFGEAAMATMPDFYNVFQCDPSKPYHGFTSWDNFFTRQLKPGARPIAFPGDDNIINNACEAAPFCLATNAKVRDRFWIKSQPYSLYDMLAGNRDGTLAPQFYGSQSNGATVYQAFLSTRSYHRWHSPINGKVLGTRMVPGTYYSEICPEGFDPAGPNDSQGYITHVATRALIYMEANNPNIGLMCFMAVGMAECSSCEVTVVEGQIVKKGQELGMFHFGGSTYCLIFRPGVKVYFHLNQTPSRDATNIPINSAIAFVGNKNSLSSQAE